MPRVAAVTGASGYLGSKISAALEADGWRVIRLVRTPMPGDSSARRYDIRDPVPDDLLDSIQVLVHAAYDFSVTSEADIWATNVNGTRRLLEAARRAGIPRIVVLSTMSAYAGTRQLYGRAKLAIEADTFAAGGIVVRPGLVYGNAPGGMAGALRKATRLPLVPLITGDAHQFPVYEEDLIQAIVAIVDAESVPPVPIGIAQATPVTFRNLLASIAARDGRVCRFVPVPWRGVYWALRIAEFLRLPVPLRADSVLGLVRPAPAVPNPDIIRGMGVSLRTLETPRW
jgi:nucleoside-diphosphate-sugar epimerase